VGVGVALALGVGFGLGDFVGSGVPGPHALSTSVSRTAGATIAASLMSGW
jgi:hypothetical protein